MKIRGSGPAPWFGPFIRLEKYFPGFFPLYLDRSKGGRSKVPHKEKRLFAAHLKQIWLQPDRKSARRAANHLAQEYEERFPEAIRCLEEGLEDSLQFYGFPEIDPKKISSTNMPERTTREVRRRSRVVGVFPSVDSWVRLETCYLMEYSEDWRTDRSYIKREKTQEATEKNRSFLQAQAVS